LKLGYNATKTLAKLQQIYGDAALSRAQVFKWFKTFSEGWESVEDESRSGRPSTSRNDENVERIRDLVRSDRRLTVRLIADEIKAAVTAQLKVIQVSEFQHCYEDWKQRLRRCVVSQGNYFERDRVNL